jgi:hypothetical protein
MRRLVILASALSTALTACAGSGTPIIGSAPATSIVAAVDRDFDLSPGQSARVDGSALTISFIGVTEDSRCPVGVQCVWAGNAVVSLSVMVNGDVRSSTSLNTTLTPRSVRIAGYEISLVALKPEPKQGVPIPQASYVTTLRAVRQ